MATKRRVTVQEAADMFGISQEAVRMRVKRGTLESEKRGGRVYILFNTDPTQDLTQDRTGDQGGSHLDELRSRVADLQDQVRYLREQLDAERQARTEERRRADTVIVQLTSRIPQLSAPPEAQNQAESASPRSDRDTPPEETEEATERRPFWRRILGG